MINIVDKLFDEILTISREKEGKTLHEMVLKCSEEVGELSQAVLSYTNACGCEYKNLDINDVKEELVDIFVVIIATASKINMTKEEFVEIAERKVIKWQQVIKK